MYHCFTKEEDMKINYRWLLPMICVFCTFQPVAAQQSNLSITFELKSASLNRSEQYPLRALNYSCSNIPGDTTYRTYDPYVVNLELKRNLDDFLLQWISGKMSDAIGTITVKDNDNDKEIRKISFEEGKTSIASESFSGNGDYGYASANIAVYVKRLIIDGLAIEAP